jgi:PAS domain S-box-containing protein
MLSVELLAPLHAVAAPILVTAGDRLLWLNRRAGVLFGLPPEAHSEAASLDLRRYLHPADVDRWGQAANDLDPDRPIRLRFRHHADDTRLFEADALFSPLDIPGGPFTLVTLRDPDAEVRAERDLLRQVLRHLPYAAVFFFDHDLRFQVAEGRSLVQAGLSHRHFVGKSLREVVDPATAERDEPAQIAALNGISTTNENEYDGRLHWMHTVPVYNEERAVIGGLALSLDITELPYVRVLREQEQRLRRSEYQMHSIVQSVPDVLYIKDLARRYVLINPAGARMVGRLVEDVIGHTDVELFGDELGRVMWETDQQVIDTQQPLTYQARRKFAGADVILDTTKVPYYSETGDLIGVIGTTKNITDRVQAEEARENSERHYRQLLDQLPIALIATSRETLEIIYFNRAAAALFDNLSAPWKERWERSLASDEQRQAFHQRLTLAQRGEVTPLREFTLAQAGDTLSYFLTQTFPVIFQGHHAMITLFVDITDRKAADEALRASELRLQAILDGSLDAIYIKNREGSYELANPAAARMFGQSQPDEMIGHDDDRFFGPEAGAEIRAIDRQVMETLEPITYESHRLINGTTVSLLSAKVPYIGPDDTVQGVIGISRDITDRVRAEQELQARERQFRALAETIPDTIYIHDLRTHSMIYCNKTEFLGYSMAELNQTNSIVAATHPDDLAKVMHLWQQTASSGTVGEVDFRIQHKDGHWEWVMKRQTIFARDDGGRPTQILVTLNTITERKQVEAFVREQEKLQVAFEKERDLSDLKTRMMRRISHEFRTPLSVILISLDLLERYYDRATPERREERMGQIRAQINHISGILEGISFVMRGQAGQLILFREVIDLSALCQSVVTQVRAASPTAHVWHCHFGQGIALRADADMIRQIMAQLLANAVKFSAPGSVIGVNVRVDDAWAVIDVTDQGIGIPADEQERIFQPFVRASNIGEVPGIGLGLSIAQTAAIAHSGTIVVASTPGGGSTFTVSLPQGG